MINEVNLIPYVIYRVSYTVNMPYTGLELYRTINMPLLFSVADAEYTGFYVSLPFFSKLKQDLSDRIR